ncbi:MAG: SPOR domain-containing protein, partial [bacterium]
SWERFLTSHPGSKLEPIALERLYFYYHLKGDSASANRFHKLLFQRHPSYQPSSLVSHFKSVSQHGREYVQSSSSHKRTLWTIQVGAFRDPTSAEKFARSLTNYGVIFTSSETNTEQQSLFRVELGRYETKSEAEKVAQKLEAERGIKGWIKPVTISNP